MKASTKIKQDKVLVQLAPLALSQKQGQALVQLAPISSSQQQKGKALVELIKNVLILSMKQQLQLQVIEHVKS